MSNGGRWSQWCKTRSGHAGAPDQILCVVVVFIIHVKVNICTWPSIFIAWRGTFQFDNNNIKNSVGPVKSVHADRNSELSNVEVTSSRHKYCRSRLHCLIKLTLVVCRIQFLIGRVIIELTTNSPKRTQTRITFNGDSFFHTLDGY